MAASPPLHTSLRPEVNLRLSVVWLLLAAFTLALGQPRPWQGAIYGLICGVVAGLLQWTAIRSNPDSFRHAAGALEVRAAMRRTRAGAAYLVWFYVFMVGQLVLAFGFTRAPLLNFAVAYFAFGCARELLSIPAVKGLTPKTPPISEASGLS